MPPSNDSLDLLLGRRSDLCEQLKLIDGHVAAARKSPFFNAPPGNAPTMREAIEGVEKRIAEPAGARVAERLRGAAARLAAEMDEARLYRAAAYASMAADAAAEALPAAQPEAEMLADVDLDFELDERGRVWMIREGDCHIIGRRNAVSAKMRRFLTTAGLGEAH